MRDFFGKIVRRSLLVLLLAFAVVILSPIMLVVEGPADCASFLSRLMRFVVS